MGKNCRVCAHPQRHLVELGLVHRLPVRILAARFDIPKTCVFRHRRLHMSPQLIAAIAMAQRPSVVDLEQLQRSESEGLIGSLVSQRARLQMLSEMAFKARSAPGSRSREPSPAHWNLPADCSA